MVQKPLTLIAIALAWAVMIPGRAVAQAVPDTTLGSESTVLQNQVIQGVPSQFVTGGAQRGNALFHSFTSFNIGAGQGVYFANPMNVTDIIGRVTGATASSINGVLGVLGSANLILINPNGINFGTTARLDLRGSFLASTATKVDFPEFSFDALNPNTPPLLINAVPIGLGFARPPAAITVDGVGHTLNFAPVPTPVVVNNPIAGAGQSVTGLRVDPGQTLALVGGEVTFSGGILSAPGGNLQVGGVDSGTAQITPSPQGWEINYTNATSSKNLQFATRSLLDISGLGGGQIRVTGGNVTLSDGSYILSQNQGFSPDRAITIDAKSLTIIGTGFDTRQSSLNELTTKSGIISNTFAGKGTDIVVNVDVLDLRNAGGLRALTYGSGSGGDIKVQANESINITGTSPLDRVLSVSIIQTITFFTGKGGNIDISTKDLRVGTPAEGGMNILAATFGLDPVAGIGGDIRINAQTIKTAGESILTASGISTASINNERPGLLQIRSQLLEVTAGAGIGSPGLAGTFGGNVDVEANSIFVSGKGDLNRSGIGTPVLPNLGVLRDPLGPAITPSTNSGNTTIRTNLLRIEDSGTVGTFNEGVGNAGNLNISANRIEMNRGAISGGTASGQGGNIFLDSNLLTLRNSSTITTSASGVGGGGSIRINSALVTLLEGSRIVANAERGFGGDVNIRAEGVFVAPGSRITATSNAGPQFDGIVQIRTLDVDLSRGGLVSIPVPSVPQIASVCGSNAIADNTFTITGAGGLPSNPNEFSIPSGWRNSTPTSSSDSVAPLSPTSEIVEAQGWERMANGTVRFVISGNASSPYTAFDCSRSEKSTILTH